MISEYDNGARPLAVIVMEPSLLPEHPGDTEVIFNEGTAYVPVTVKFLVTDVLQLSVTCTV